MTKRHSQITAEDEVHYPKGFPQASIDQQRVGVKQTNGTFEWVPSSEIGGVAGPAGPPIQEISVANIRNPSELNAVDDTNGDQVIAIQSGASPSDRQRSSYYLYQSGATMPEYPPLVVDGLNGKWILLSGESVLLSAMESASTSTLFGGNITINGTDAATFDIDDTLVELIDNYTDGVNPKQTFVFVPATTGVAVDNIATFDDSFVFIGAGGLTQATTISDAAFFRDNAFLATIFHSNNVEIGSISNVPSFSLSPSLALDDLGLAMGPINFSGNIFGPNGANLAVNKTAGSTFEKNVSARSNLKNPNFSVDQAITGTADFFRSYRDGSGGFTYDLDTVIDPLIYDDGTGILATVPATEWSLRRLYWHPSLDTGTELGVVASVTGIETYATKDEALDAISTSNWFIPEALNFASHRATLAVIQSATDLSDDTQAVFVNHGKFGGGSVSAGSPAVVTLQEAYDNSSGSPIITTAPGNPFTVRRGGAASTTIIDLKNDSDVSVFDINNSGAITGTDATQSQQGLMSTVDKTKLDGLAQGWMQYSNGNIFSSASITPVAITLDVDEASFANSLFTKLNATQIQTDFNGFVEISWGGNGNGNANDSAGGLVVQKNGTDLSISENTQGCGRVLFELGISRTFLVNCAVNDNFELNFFTPSASTFDFAVGDIHMYVKAIRTT